MSRPLTLDLPIRTSQHREGGMSQRQQRERAEDVIRRSGGRYVLGKVFDSGKSESGKTLDRASLRAIRERIRTGESDGVVLGYLDRLGRAPIEESMAFVRGLVEVDGGKLVAADWSDEPIDLADPNVEDMLVFRLQMNRSQWNKSAARHRENVATAKRDGKFVGPASYGYTKRGGKLVEHPVEGARMREVFRRVARGTLHDGVDYLREVAPTRERRRKGETVTVAAVWNTDNVRKMLRSRTYRGEHDGVEYPGHVALVTESTWQAVQTKLTPRDRRRNGGYLLSGLVHCLECGGPLVGALQTSPAYKRASGDWRTWEVDELAPKRQYRRYRCGSCSGGSVRAEALDEYVRTELKSVLGDRAVRERLGVGGVDDARSAWEAAQDELEVFAVETSARSPLFAKGLAKRERDVEETEREYRRLVGLAASSVDLPEAAELDDDETLRAALRTLAARGLTLALRRGRGALVDRVVWLDDGEVVPGALAA